MNKTIKTKAVIFDRDGVIINTEPVIIDSVKKTFKKLGLKVQEEDFSQLVGRGPDIYKDYFPKEMGFNFDEFRKIQRELFYQNLNQAEFFQNTLELIKTLHVRKVPLAVTTSAGREGTLLILSNGGIDNMFKVIVTKEDCKNLKPDPEPYITTARKLDIEPKFCVVIEDTALGVESAKKAGMMCIAIPNEFTKNQDFSMADLVAQSAKEVEDILEFIQS
jgi:HAD superfamily hydrolase (TIGR01509 family)